MKRKRFVMLRDEQFDNDIQLIKNEGRCSTDSQAVRFALGVALKKLMPEYLRMRKEAKPRKEYATARDRVEAELEKKKQMALAKIARGLEIAEELDGTVTELPSGERECTWTIYEKLGKTVAVGKRTLAVELLSEGLLADQFRGGTREEILELVEAGKVL